MNQDISDLQKGDASGHCPFQEEPSINRMISYISEPMSSYDGDDDYLDSDDELTDRSVLDKKLDNITIMKIENSIFVQRMPTIDDINDSRIAEKIIEQIVFKGKRKNDDNSSGLEKKRSRLNPAAAVLPGPAVHKIVTPDQQPTDLTSDSQHFAISNADLTFKSSDKYLHLESQKTNATFSSSEDIASSKDLQQNKQTDFEISPPFSKSVASNTTLHSVASSDTHSSTPSTQEKGVQVDISSIPTPPIEMHLKSEIKQILKEKENNYKLKLYLVEAKQESSFSKLFSELLTEKSRIRLRREKEVSKSYILFFYRNIQNTSITPEIYALTTGSAWLKVSEYVDKDFTRLVERRTLRFPFHRVKCKRDGGHIMTESQSARPGHEITFSTRDYLGKLVGNRTRSIREHSSLYANSLNAFRTKNGKPITSKFQLSENTMKIQRKLSISQLACILDHFSKICANQKTFQVDENGDLTQKEEIDDSEFEMHNFTTEVKDKKRIRELNESLFQVMKQSMKGNDSHIFLSHDSFSEWSSADEFKLYARPKSDEKASTSEAVLKVIKHKRKNIATWRESPSLETVMLKLNTICGDEFKEEWLSDVIIKFGSTDAPLKKCIFSRFNKGDAGTYIYNHGVWIEMKAQYLYHIERDFVKLVSAHLLESSKLPLLLPWKHPGGGNSEKKESGQAKEKGKTKKKIYTVKNFDMTQMKPKWKTHFETICKGDQFDILLREAESLTQGNTDLTFNFQSLERMSTQKKAANLYRILECNLNEDDYNAAHTLLNMIRPHDSKTRVITCDKKTPHGIELCDILMFNATTTYLVHVKGKFKGGPIRDVCSQIRNAAENIYREQTITGGTGIIEKYWEVLTEVEINPKTHTDKVKRLLEDMTKEEFKNLFHATREIVFILACRDTRTRIDFSRDIPLSNDKVVDVRGAITNKFSKKSSVIIDSLTKKGYLTDQGTPTTKFILEGKQLKYDKKRFLNSITSWDSIGSFSNAEAVRDILLSVLPSSEATIAKMEIIRLIHSFQQYWVGERQLHLKLFSIGKDFPDM